MVFALILSLFVISFLYFMGRGKSIDTFSHFVDYSGSVGFGVSKLGGGYYLNTYVVSGTIESEPHERDGVYLMKVKIPAGSKLLDYETRSDLTIELVIGPVEKSEYLALIVDNFQIPDRQEWKQTTRSEIFSQLKRADPVVVYLVSGLGYEALNLKDSDECDVLCKAYLELVDKYAEQTNAYFGDFSEQKTGVVGVLNKILINKI